MVSGPQQIKISEEENHSYLLADEKLMEEDEEEAKSPPFIVEQVNKTTTHVQSNSKVEELKWYLLVAKPI